MTFENAVVTLVAFLAIAGGTAYAAGHLGKNSVGKKQLKAASVTAAKLKKNAVTTAKIKKAAISSPKVKDGTIGSAAFDPSSNPFSGIVQTTTSTGTTTGEPTFGAGIQVPLSGNTFTQMPGETIYIVGQLHYSTAGGCGAGEKKLIFFYVEYDSPDPSKSPPGHEIAVGAVYDVTGTDPAEGIRPISSFDEGSIPPPASPTPRTLTMEYGGLCETSGTASVSEVQLDVIGVK